MSRRARTWLTVFTILLTAGAVLTLAMGYGTAPY